MLKRITIFVILLVFAKPVYDLGNGLYGDNENNR